MGFGCMDASFNGDVALTSVWGKSVLRKRQGKGEAVREEQGKEKSVQQVTVPSGFRIPEAVLRDVGVSNGKSWERKR